MSNHFLYTNPRSSVGAFGSTTSVTNGDWDSAIDISTPYRLGGPGIESRDGEIFCTSLDRYRDLPILLYSGYRSLSWGKSGSRGVLTTHPILTSRMRMYKSVLLPPLCAFIGTVRVTFTFLFTITNNQLFSNKRGKVNSSLKYIL